MLDLFDGWQLVLDAFGRVNVLINGADGNKPDATVKMPDVAFRWVSDLNFMGTILPTQVFGKYMAARGAGNILNISSMNAFRPLTNITACSATKAAVSNFTQWLATYMAVNHHNKQIRVNAVAPAPAA